MTGRDEIDHAYSLAEGFVDTGRYDEAARLIAGLLTKDRDPDLPRLRDLLSAVVDASDNAGARVNLALVLMHEDADATPEEVSIAVTLLQEAADLAEDPSSGQGSRTVAALAHGLLGDCFVAGRGTEADAGTAVLHYRRAAEQGNGKAALNVALALDGGVLDQPVDKDEAAHFYRIAVEAGEPRAMTNLALLYMSDLEPPDEVTVVDLLERARDLGDDNAAEVLDQLYRDTIGEEPAED
ncbi:MAG: tetratricopeptide repeat protein [Azospirillaceae bacterium]